MKRIWIVAIVLILVQLPLIAQDKPYVIENIEVLGLEGLDKRTIINTAGIYVGMTVADNQLILGQSIKNLWKLEVFEEVSLYHEEGKRGHIVIDLEISPRITSIYFEGITKKEIAQLRSKILMPKGRRLTPLKRKRIKNKINAFFKAKGYENTIVSLDWKEKTTQTELKIVIQKTNRLRIGEVKVLGNSKVTDKQLKKVLKPLRKKYGLIKPSFHEELVKDVIASMKMHYNSLGYADFEVKNKTIESTKDGLVNIEISLDEGPVYHISHIQWEGNSKYSDEELMNFTNLKEGLIYDPIQIEESLHYKPDGKDIRSLYMNQGYLFFNVQQQIVSAENNEIQLKILINEGEQATIRDVSITGNTITKDHVVLRNIHTLPGDYFDRNNLIRSQSNLATLGFFNPNTISVKPIPRPNDGTVDLVYEVEEQPTDKYEFTGTLNGPSGFAGGLGLVLNNFSSKDLFKFKNWQTFPRGDGEKLAIRYNSSGKSYNSLSFNYSNPWLDTKKPTSFFISTNYSRLIDIADEEEDLAQDGRLNIIGGSIGLTTKLNWPDDYFSWTKSLSFYRYSFDNYQNSLNIDEGQTNLFSFTNTLSRNKINHPFFPTTGSQFSASLSITPPFSLFRDQVNDDNPYELAEYFKILIDYSKYKKVKGKLTLKLGAHFGLIDNYSNKIPLGPFERFHLGGTGITGQDVFRGNDLVGLRGYEADALVPVDSETGLEGGVIYQKANVELRFPISLNTSYSAYIYGFAEIGNTFSSIKSYNPLDVYKSAGIGARFNIPFVGQFGLDWSYGFDTLPNKTKPSGERLQFTIGMPIR